MTDHNRYIMAMAEGLVFGFHSEHEIELKVWQRLVGGLIEITYPFKHELAVGICWEEARLFGSPVNRLATLVHGSSYGYSMVGDFLFAGDTPSGDFTGLSDTAIGLINSAGGLAGLPVVASFHLTLRDAMEVVDERRASQDRA